MHFNGVGSCGGSTVLMELPLLDQMLDCIAEAIALLCCVAIIVMVSAVPVAVARRCFFGNLLLGGRGMRSLCLAHMSSYVVVRVVWTS